MEDDAAIEHYWSLNPKQFSALERLTMHWGKGDDGIFQLSLETWLRASYDDEEDRQRLHINFHNVAQLDIHEGGLAMGVIFIIHSIKDQQWEKLKYRMLDVEEQALSFYCQRFEANIELG